MMGNQNIIKKAKYQRKNDSKKKKDRLDLQMDRKGMGRNEIGTLYRD